MRVFCLLKKKKKSLWALKVIVALDLLIYLHLYSENKQMSNGFGTTLMTLFIFWVN